MAKFKCPKCGKAVEYGGVVPSKGRTWCSESDASVQMRKVRKKPNPIAKDLRTPKYRKRIVKDRTKYDRKKGKANE